MRKRKRKSKRKGSNGRVHIRAVAPVEAPDTSEEARAAAFVWLRCGKHREGCQCHRCHWALSVKRGLVVVTFDAWRAEKPR